MDAADLGGTSRLLFRLATEPHLPTWGKCVAMTLRKIAISPWVLYSAWTEVTPRSGAARPAHKHRINIAGPLEAQSDLGKYNTYDL
jgi:hypothetical protein